MYVFLKPFKWQVWLAIGVSIPVTAAVLLTLAKTSLKTYEHKLNGFMETFFYMYSLAMKQGIHISFCFQSCFNIWV